MTLAELSDISQALGAVAVFASLIFVGYQIRQNTRALKATSHHAIADSFNALNTLLVTDPRVARLWRLGMADWDALDEDDRTSVSFMLLGYMRIFETLHYQYGTGVLGPKLFEAELNTLKWSVTNPGFVAWWAANPISLSAEYRAFIDGLIREAQEKSTARP
jgi:hypothetical protein